jgi:hypothetical protein
VAQGLQDRPFPLGPLSKIRTTRGSHCYGATRYMPRDVRLQTADSKGVQYGTGRASKPKTGHSRAVRLRTYGNVTIHPAPI